MSGSLSLSRRTIWENDGIECFTCSRKFRCGDRRRNLNLKITVCAACHRSHAHFQSTTCNTDDESAMEVDISNDQTMSDAATQTDFDSLGQEAIVPSTTTSTTVSENVIVSTEVHSDTIYLPFFRTSKSHSQCSICKIYFTDCNSSAKIICDSIRARALVDHHIFIPEKSRCCSIHLNLIDLKESAYDLVKHSYDKNCMIKTHELIQSLEILKTELNKNVSNRI